MTRTRAPLALVAPAVATVALVLLPLSYLVVRAAGGGTDALRVLEREGTFELVLRTGVLVAAVVAGACAIGLPLAFLVTRTDLPARRVLAVLAPLPLVIPSYVAALALLGAFGPRGLLQRLLDQEGLFWRAVCERVAESDLVADLHVVRGGLAALVEAEQGVRQVAHPLPAERADGARAILAPSPAAEPPAAHRDPLLSRQVGDLIFRPYDGDLRLGRFGQCPGRDERIGAAVRFGLKPTPSSMNGASRPAIRIVPASDR